MTILPSSASLLARQFRLLISPPTTTLFESRAILSEIQSKFGPVSTFVNERNDQVLRRLLNTGGPKHTASPVQPPVQTILAICDSPASKQSALDASPLTISCGGDLLPSPEELDPYNARGLHGRYHPPKRTFTCHMVDEEDPTIHHRLTKRNPYNGPFLIDTLQMSLGDLNRCGTPLKEMTDIMQTERAPTDGAEKSKRSRGFYSDFDKMKDPQHNGGLMAAWRRGMQKAKSGEKPQ